MSAVHTSHALRAQRTAAPLAATHGLDVEVVDGAHEVRGDVSAGGTAI